MERIVKSTSELRRIVTQQDARIEELEEDLKAAAERHRRLLDRIEELEEDLKAAASPFVSKMP